METQTTMKELDDSSQYKVHDFLCYATLDNRSSYYKYQDIILLHGGQYIATSMHLFNIV